MNVESRKKKPKQRLRKNKADYTICFTRRNTLFHKEKHFVSVKETFCFTKRNTLFHKGKQIRKRLRKVRNSCCLVVLLTCCPLKSAFATSRTLREIILSCVKVFIPLWLESETNLKKEETANRKIIIKTK